VDRIYKMLFEKKGSKNRVVSSELGALPKGMRPASPEQVFKNLNINKTFSGDDISKSIGALLNAAKLTTPAINESYGKIVNVKDENGITGIVIKMQGLDVRNGTRYLKILIENAFNIGALRGNDDIRVQRVSDVALIYPSRGGSPRWKGTVKSV